MASNLFITNTRMLQFMELTIEKQMQGVSSKTDFCNLIGFDRLNLSKVEKGTLSFQHYHLQSAGKIFNLNLNWLFGLESEMFRAIPSFQKPVPAKA